jgi:hypothetical protein
MNQQDNARVALARGDFRSWLVEMCPDEWEDIMLRRPNGEVVSLVAARIGATQFGITPTMPGQDGPDILVHTHATVEAAEECFRRNVNDARRDADRINRVASMEPGLDQARALVELLDELRDSEPAPVSWVAPPGVREVSAGPDEYPTGLYL